MERERWRKRYEETERNGEREKEIWRERYEEREREKAKCICKMNSYEAG